MPDTVVIGRLSHYGRVLSFRRDFGAATHVHNGVHTVRMRLSSAIPSSVRITGKVIFLSYPGQPRTCRRCGEEGHVAQGCKKLCFNCEAPGHVSSECNLEPLCGVCLKSDHHESDCPYVILSANVEPVALSPSYADVIRQNRPASPAAPPPADHQQRKRKADTEQSRSVTPVLDRQVNPEERGKVRRCETEENREEHKPCDRGREDRQAHGSEDERHRHREEHHQDQESEQESRHHHHREDRREDRRRERDRERESERDRRREGHRPREHSERDRWGNHDRRRSPNRRPRRDHSPELFSSDSEADDMY